ncbi:MAG: YvcK family protein [Bacilli bacterium]|nr:YvcK family protein [Bacilli bacterium]
MNKKVVVLGGGTGMSSLLRGLKQFPFDITAVVSVCDDGASTGRLRKEFNIPAVGDIRKVLISLSETEPLFEKLLDYRFNTTSDLDGHAVGNLLLTAMANISGNMSDGIESIGKILNLKGNVLPLTEDNVTLVAQMKDGKVIEGEHNITEYHGNIEKIYYKSTPVVNNKVLEAIKKADLIILSMGSIYTSILPNLLCEKVISQIDKSTSKLMYVCNMMTQPGETDRLSVSEHVKILNKYLGNHKVDVVVANNGSISNQMKNKYATLEQKDPVVIDYENLYKLNVDLIEDDFVNVDSDILRHNAVKLALRIFSYLIS